MSFGSDRRVKLSVGATMDGFVNELDRGTRAGQQWSKSVAANAKQAAVALHSVRNEAKEVAVPLLAIGTVAAAGVAYAIKSYADFDEKMSSVKSLSHATADEQRQLKQAALDTGTAIGFSATQAADAEIELVKAGVQANDIYGGALAGSLKLAAAGQIDVADATSIAASTMVQFNLKGRDVGHIADLLAAGADKALGGVQDLGEGLKYIGPVAASSNISLEQTVGTMALLAQNGILGQQAGTSLRGVLLSLTAPSKLASDTMKQYGINVYDAQGKFIGFNGAAEQLHKRLGTLGDAERDAALGRIFGNEQITAATVLMNGGAGAVDKWTKAVNEQGFATEQALGKMDNLNGDLTKLKATFQTAAIVTGEAADGPLRAAVQVVTDLLETYSQAPAAAQGVVLGVGALTAAVALSSGTLLVAVPRVVEFGKALQVLSASNIPGVSTAAAGALKAVNGLGRGLGAAATFMTGPFGLALAAAALAVHTFDMAASSGAASQKELESAITHTVSAAKLLDLAGQRSDLSKFLVGDVAGQLKDIPALLDRTTDGWAQFYSMVSIGGASADQKTQQALKSLRAVGTELGQVAEVNAPAAAKAFNQIVDSQKLSNDQAQKLLNGPFSDYKSELMNQARALGIATDKTNLMLLATGEYDAAAAKAKDPTKENSEALDDLKTAGESAAQQVENVSNALKGLTSPTLDAREAQRQFQAAIDAVSASIKDNGTSLDITTEKGRANQAALDGIAQSAENAAGSIYTQTGSQEQATAAMQAGRDELVRALGQYGITGQAAQDYADTIIGTPTQWATTFSNSAPQAGALVSEYLRTINSLPAEKRTNVNAATTAAKLGIQSVLDTLSKIPTQKTITITTNRVNVATPDNTVGIFKPNGKAAGGEIRGPGTGTSDDVPIWASNGEWVVRERAASMYGPRTMSAINAGLVDPVALGTLVAGGLTSAVAIAGQSVKSGTAATHWGAGAYASGGPVLTPAQYAAPKSQINVQVLGSSEPQPLVGKVDMTFAAGTPRQGIDQLMFALRTLDRGGR